jgi:hypothetical protein
VVTLCGGSNEWKRNTMVELQTKSIYQIDSIYRIDACTPSNNDWPALKDGEPVNMEMNGKIFVIQFKVFE